MLIPNVLVLQVKVAGGVQDTLGLGHTCARARPLLTTTPSAATTSKSLGARSTLERKLVI